MQLRNQNRPLSLYNDNEEKNDVPQLSDDSEGKSRQTTHRRLELMKMAKPATGVESQPVSVHRAVSQMDCSQTRD